MQDDRPASLDSGGRLPPLRMADRDAGEHAGDELPYRISLVEGSIPDLPDELPVYELREKAFSVTCAQRIARKLGFEGDLQKRFGESPDQVDAWEIKDDTHRLACWPDLWMWDWADRSYFPDAEWILEERGGRPDPEPTSVELTCDEIDRIVRERFPDQELLPPDAEIGRDKLVQEEFLLSPEGETRRIALYGVIYRRLVEGCEILGSPNSCVVTVTPSREVVKFEARWVELEPVGVFPLRSVSEAFSALREGRGEPLYGPFLSGSAHFSGLYYWADGPREDSFHPVYRFTVQGDGGLEQHFFAPAVRDTCYRDGVSAVWSAEPAVLSLEQIRARVRAMVAQLERDCGPLLEARPTAEDDLTEERYGKMYFAVPELAESIAPNVVPEVEREWADAMLNLADRLLSVLRTDSTALEEPAARQVVEARIAESLCDLVTRRGSADVREEAQKLKGRHAQLLRWAHNFVFDP